MHIIYYILFFIGGSLMGSFYTLVGLRLPKNEPIVFSRSKCDECKHILGILDLVPILSFVFLRGKCRYCKNRIDILSTYVEFFTGVLFVVSYHAFGFTFDLAIALGIVSLLVLVIVSDLTYLIIPDEFLMFFGIYFLIFRFLSTGIIDTLYHVLVGVFLFIVMYVIMLFGNKLFKKESMGGGDVKMMFLFGIVLDPLLGILTIFLGSLFALPISFVLYLSKNERVIPFGPFLLLGFAFIYFVKLTPGVIINYLGF